MDLLPKQRLGWFRMIMATLGFSIVLLTLLTLLEMNRIMANPNEQQRWFYIPASFTETTISIGVLPCTATESGQIYIGRDVIAIPSHSLPPGWSWRTTAPCP